MVSGSAVLIVVKFFCDGSKEDRKRSITLAGVAALEEVWGELEARWRTVLSERGNPPYMHMTDAMSLQGVFKGWEEADRDHLVDGCLALLNEFKPKQIYSATASVDLDAHSRIKQKRELPSPPRICSRLVWPHLLDWYARIPVTPTKILLDPIDGYFDRNEPFMHHIQADWKNKKIRQRFPVWGMVRTIAPVAMETTPQIQMADMIAWGRNRLSCGSLPNKDKFHEVAMRAANALHGIHRPVDEHALINGHWREEGFEKINTQFRKGRA